MRRDPESADPVKNALEDLFYRCGLELTPARLVPLSGGSINRVMRVDTREQTTLLFKWHEDPPAGFFEAERQGLDTLRATKTLLIPEVCAASQRGILMEWLPPAPVPNEDEQGHKLGRDLAALHRHEAETYGFAENNFTGLLPQTNTPAQSWIDFYRERRLEPQVRLAKEQGRLPPQRSQGAERLMERLPRWIDGAAVTPSLIHGDLWAGNWLMTARGPALIDPAVYYGDREMDLAMASLFGGFPQSFFQAYAEAYPPLPGYVDRRPLYQLYYLLIHLNIFGESYGASVDRILRRYGDLRRYGE